MIDPGRGCEPGTQAALWQINGQPISDPDSSVKFFVGNQARLRVGRYPPESNLTGWALKVIRKIR
jgi:hypothetical protein